MPTTTPGVLPQLGDQVKKATENTVRRVTQETHDLTDVTLEQVNAAPAKSEPMTADQKKATRDEVEGMYGGAKAVMEPAKYEQKAEADKKYRSNLIEQILGQLLPQHRMRDDRKQKIAAEHKRSAEELGTPNDEGQQKAQLEAQKKKDEEELAKKKEEERKAKLENTIEAPAGKQTGLSMNRKATKPRMQAPPNAENRGGKGNRE